MEGPGQNHRQNGNSVKALLGAVPGGQGAWRT